MIGWFSCLMSGIMVTNRFNVHYYERYVNFALYLKRLAEAGIHVQEMMDTGQLEVLPWTDPRKIQVLPYSISVLLLP